jgi:cysteine-rich repeat protein
VTIRSIDFARPRAFGIRFLFLLSLLAFPACESGDSGDDADGAVDEDGGGNRQDGGADGSVDGGPDGGAGPDGGPGAVTCGNGKKDSDLEECDDGNFDDWDGCTSLCTFTCSEDDECDDLNSCNGEEVCTDDHACDDSDPDLADGVECGPLKSCWQGLCVDDVCGDGVESGDEQCDDGNLDETDGCTPECEFTCTDNSDCAGGDECAGAAQCDTDKHICQGDPLADETPCDGNDGWCISGVCVPFNCGDGRLQGNEQCDEGKDNGKPGVECSVYCTVTSCGNGTVEGNEQCDDGNDEKLDSCDPECRWETAHRMTYTVIRKGYIPEFCVHQQNRFGEAWASRVELFPGFTFDVLNDFVNPMLNGDIADGERNAIFHITGTDDNSLRTRDDDITIGYYTGLHAAAWEEGPPIDFPFWVDRDSVDKNMDPARKHSIPARQGGGGRVVSRKPADVEIESSTGVFTMYDYMLRVVYDVDTLTTPSGPPEASSKLKLPEEAGFGDPEARPYTPAGTFCGAMVPNQETLPISGRPAEFCCNDQGALYRQCDGDVVTPDCDGYNQVLLHGCWICVNMGDPMGGSDCSLYSTGSCVQIIKPIAYDVDTDDDGDKDAWSAVMGFEAKRIRMRGLTPE